MRPLPNSLFAATLSLVAAASAGLSAQPLPHGSLNQTGRGLELANPGVSSGPASNRSCVDGACLEVTLSPADAGNPDACGTQTTLAVAIGDAVNVCYRFSNHTTRTLNRHSLTDSTVGALFIDHEHVLGPNETFQYNRVILASTNRNATHGEFQSTWVAGDAGASFTVAAEADLAVGAPEIVIDPDPATGVVTEVEQGFSVTESIQIGNAGGAELEWSFSPLAANSRFPANDRSAVIDAQRSPSAPTPVSPALRGAVNHETAGADILPAYALRGRAGGVDQVRFDLHNATSYETIRELQVFMFAADFVNDDFSHQVAVTSPNSGFRQLVHVDSENGDVTVIADLEDFPQNRYPIGASWDRTTGRFYFSALHFGTTSSHLYWIDLDTSELHHVGQMGSGLLVEEIAIDAAGVMYGIDSVQKRFLVIDKDTAAFETIGPLGVAIDFNQGLDFDDATGTLYLMAAATPTTTGIYTVDVNTGVATWHGPVYGEGGGFSIVSPAPASCDNAETAPWLSYDIGSGVVAPNPSTPSTVNLSLDASALEIGTYTANLCVYSNDPQQSVVVLPVALTVTEYDDTIFRNGFEGE